MSRLLHPWLTDDWAMKTFLVLCLCIVLFTVSPWLSWVLCVPCALVDCLAPPTLLPRYWIICSTWLPSLFAFLFSFPVFAVLCSIVVNVMGVESCVVLSALPCPTLPCHVFDLVFSFWDLDFLCWFVWFMFHLVKTSLQLCTWVLTPFSTTHPWQDELRVKLHL